MASQKTPKEELLELVRNWRADSYSTERERRAYRALEVLAASIPTKVLPDVCAEALSLLRGEQEAERGESPNER